MKTPSLTWWSKIALSWATTSTRRFSEPSNTQKHHRHSSNVEINRANTISLGSVMYMATALLKSPELQGAQQSNETQHSPPQQPPPKVCSLGGGRVLGVYSLIFVWVRMLGKKRGAVAGRIWRGESFRFCLWCYHSGRRCCLEKRKWGLF